MSSNLWIGNLASDVSDSDLKNMFEKHGGVDSVTCYSSRNYAFVYMNNVEDARRAKDNLNGVVLHGHPLKIDFAKPAKPCKCLWITGIGTSISKEDIEEKFSKYGKFEDFKFQQDKNAAIIEYFKLEDAIKAVKAMRGTKYRVDYSRSHSTRHNLPSEGKKQNEELPSSVLCISYPPVVHFDEQMLHNALILFGEIETIKSFPSRYCSFVEFRSVEEALHAKNGLQGKLFNDPRISITFSTNGPTPSPYSTGPRGPIGPRPCALANGIPFHAPQWDLNWRSSPSPSMNPLTKSTLGTWDDFDTAQIQREPKRLRSDGNMPVKEMNNRVLQNDQTFRSVPSYPRFTWGSPKIDRADLDYIWRGTLAKGGTHVCRARCVPIGDWIGYDMPEVVNCSARTGLDMLAKHYADAIGFDTVFFLPDSEEDFASYTEFLHYMGDRNRAGVVKFDDGTTLFLVPPSDFLKTVLKVSGPARLYGVVLKFPPHPSDKLPSPTISQQHVKNHAPPVTATSAAPVGLSLIPELVASLASLAKFNSNGQQLLPESQFQGKIYEQEKSNLSNNFMQSNKVNDPNLVVTNNGGYIQDPSFNGPRHIEVASFTNSSFQTSQVTQQYQADDPHALHTAGNVVTSSSQVYDTNVYETQSMVPGQQKQEFDDADKNQRYQSTLQFAANLLFQIQQKRSGTEAVGNQ